MIPDPVEKYIQDEPRITNLLWKDSEGHLKVSEVSLKELPLAKSGTR